MSSCSRLRSFGQLGREFEHRLHLVFYDHDAELSTKKLLSKRLRNSGLTDQEFFDRIECPEQRRVFADRARLSFSDAELFGIAAAINAHGMGPDHLRFLWNQWLRCRREFKRGRAKPSSSKPYQGYPAGDDDQEQDVIFNIDKDHYKALGIRQGALLAEIKARYVSTACSASVPCIAMAANTDSFPSLCPSLVQLASPGAQAPPGQEQRESQRPVPGSPASLGSAIGPDAP